jgi:uncharacterized membrane protein YgcG
VEEPSTEEPTQPEEPETPVTPEPEPENPSEESQEPPIEEPPAEVPPVEEPTPPTVDEAVKDALADGKLTEAEKEVVAEALLASVAPGEALTSEAIAAAGIEFKDLPAETPVDVRTDENGNAVIITAEVAAALVVLENPAELIGAIFEDPGQVLLALGSIGADMSPEEREEATDMVVATVVAAGAAMNAVGAAAGATGGSTGGSTGGGGSSGGGGGPSGESKGVRRRPKP